MTRALLILILSIGSAFGQGIARVTYDTASGQLLPTNLLTDATLIQSAWSVKSLSAYSNATNYVVDVRWSENTLTVAGAVNFLHSTNRASGTNILASVVLRNTSGSAQTLAFNSSWKFLVSKPTSLDNNKVARLDIISTGSAETDILANYMVEGGTPGTGGSVWDDLSTNSLTAKLDSNVWQNAWGSIATNALTGKLASNANLGDWALYSTNALRSTATNSVKWLTNLWGDVARGFGGLADGQVLKYHGASATWTNGTDNTSAGGSGWPGVDASATNVTIYGSNLTVRADASSHTGLRIEGNTNSYFQLNLQNASSGASASSDLVITANNGTETTRYVDLGINGSGGGAAPFTTANHAYLYSIDDVLNLGALGTSPNSQIRIHAGGGLSPVEIGRFDTNGLRLRAGQSASNIWVAGTMFIDTSSLTNCCGITTLTNMHSATIPGNVLTNNGDTIRWSIAGRMATGLASTNNIAVVFGSQTVLDTGLQIASNRMWTATGTITRTGNTSQRFESTLWWPGAGSFAISTNLVGDIAQTNGIDTVLSVRGASRRVAVLTNMLLKVVYEPAPR